jgi:hypothetical protein
LKSPTNELEERATVAIEAALFFAAVFSVYVASPVVNSGDSHFAIPTAISILRHGDANIDEYASRFPEAAWSVRQENGHYWHVYPIGATFIALPFVWLADKTEAMFGKDLEADAIQKSPLLLERMIGSFITASAVAVLFCILREELALGQALLLGVLFAFGTPAYSTASRGLWGHGPSLLLISAAILLYKNLTCWKMPGAITLGLVAGYSYAVRPSNMILIAGFGVLIAVTMRRWLLPYICGAALGVAPVFAFHLAAYGTWSSMYYRMLQGSIFQPAILPVGPLMAILFSPSRGLFIFSPFLLFVLLRNWKRHRITPIEILLSVFCVAWVIGTARWPLLWTPGGYGPRLLSETAPCLLILLIPVVKNLSLERGRTLAVVFVTAGALSVAIHLRGATAPVIEEWSWKFSQQQVWRWDDPQFLYGMGR